LQSGIPEITGERLFQTAYLPFAFADAGISAVSVQREVYLEDDRPERPRCLSTALPKSDPPNGCIPGAAQFRAYQNGVFLCDDTLKGVTARMKCCDDTLKITIVGWRHKNG
jgi:hypothetical protein